MELFGGGALSEDEDVDHVDDDGAHQDEDGVDDGRDHGPIVPESIIMASLRSPILYQ